MSNNRKDPFHVQRDIVVDNQRIVRKQRLDAGAEIRARKMYATANLSQSNENVYMPYNGNMYVTVANKVAPQTITIINPYIVDENYSPILVNVDLPTTAPTVETPEPGKVVLTLTSDDAATYVVSVGEQTNAYSSNPYSQ